MIIMTMKTLTILQFIEIFGVYILMTTIVPSIVLNTRIKGKSFCDRFLISYITGNFFIMNLVFALQLLKISNRATLILSTIVVCLIAWKKMNRVKLEPYVQNTLDVAKRICNKSYGGKNLLLHIREYIRDCIKKLFAKTARLFLKHGVECLLLIVTLVAITWIYGRPIIQGYGYGASDTPVHLFWINAMDENNIFVDGVYPFGYHNVIYYLHKVFNIDTYIFMRVFGFVQAIMLHLVLIMFIRMCCSNKLFAYGPVLFFVLSKYWDAGTYLRYSSVLPQEYGMIFILPSIYYVFRFFENRRNDKDKNSKYDLTLFAMSFSMTLAVHFYDTMIAGLFCIGIAAGYLVWFVNKKYFFRIIVAGFISVMAAVLPMGIAFVLGTPLQGSLGWGMSVINGEKWVTSEEEAAGENLTENGVKYYDAEGNLLDIKDIEAINAGKNHLSDKGNTSVSGTGRADKNDVATDVKKASFGQIIVGVFKIVCDGIQSMLFVNPLPWFYLVVIGMEATVFVMGVIHLISKKRKMYGAMLVSTAVFMLLMSLLLNAKELGIPELMDAGRCRIYYAYMVVVLAAFAADSFISLVFAYKKLRIAGTLISGLSAMLIVCYFAAGNNIKPDMDTTRLVTNEAITCLTNIIHDEKDDMWTIVSANDERQMVENHGYHYELITFLREMEHIDTETEDSEYRIKIPTPSVYIFIEKKPIDYTESYSKSGQMVSKDGAIRQLPNIGGIEMYKGEKRFIVMSKLYYWAEQFKKLHPNEVITYFENDNFVCYKVKQNVYRLIDFGIDYGYNW